MEWQNKRLSETENSIYGLYVQLIKEILAALGQVFAKHEKEGVLTYFEMVKFNRLKKLMESLTTHINTMSKAIQEDMQTLLRESYEHSYYFMGHALETGIQQSIGYTALTLDMIDVAIRNPVKGLTLNKTLEKNRKQIIYTIQQTVARGLQEGATYKTMANQLQTVFEQDYKKAIRVARTEAHRVNEKAAYDSMQRADAKGVRSLKTWHHSADERVRKTKIANHWKLEGQTVDIHEMFELGNGQKGIAPGNTGFAHHDINCRCFLTYDVITIEKPTNDELADLTFEDWKNSLSDDSTSLKANGNQDEITENEAVFVGKMDTTDEQAIINQLSKYENEIVHDTIENAYVILGTGEIYSFKGNEYSVNPLSLGNKLKGSYITHNHPANQTHYSFSDDDISLFLTHELSVLRAVDEMFTYQLVRMVNTVQVDDAMIAYDFDMDGYHETIASLAKKYRIEYKRWLRE